MKIRRLILVISLIIIAQPVAACASPTPDVMEVVKTVVIEVSGESRGYPYPKAPVEAPAETEEPMMEDPGKYEVFESETDSTVSTAYPAPELRRVANSQHRNDPQNANRLIIKNGDITLLVKDTDIAISRLTQIVGDIGGYIISSRAWYEEYHNENYKYASYTIGVPVDQFEYTLGRLREIAIRVLDEIASGQDVSDEYVDLKSQLENLEATRDRIRTFLDQAKNTEEALEVNEQLAEVETQIAQIQGRMNYLFDRAAFSTITISIIPELPDLTPTPTATVTPTPTPTLWDPGKTFQRASKTLANITRGTVDALIWIVVVLLPIVGLPLLILFGLWACIRRIHRKHTQQPTDKHDDSQEIEKLSGKSTNSTLDT